MKNLLTVLALILVLGYQSNAQNTFMNFDGSNDGISVPDGFPGVDELTIECWVNMNSLGTWDAIMNHETWSPGKVHYQFAPNTRLEFSVNNNNPVDIYFNYTFSTNTWYHLAVVYSSIQNNVKLYVNGQLAETRNYSVANPTVAGNVPFEVGYWNNMRYFDGNMDELRIWDHARDQQKIQALMSTELSGGETGLLAYYNFNEGECAENNTGLLEVNDGSPYSRNGFPSNFAQDGCTSNWICGGPICGVAENGVIVPSIPTMGQWALMLFGLIITTLFVVFVYNKQLATA